METSLKIMSRKIQTACLAFLLTASAPQSLHAEKDDAVKPFLDAHCVRCHGAEKQKGKVALHEVVLDFADSENADLWLRVLEQLTSEDMPPPDEDEQPSDPDRSAVIQWIDQKLLAAGSGDAYRKKLLAPEYGNRVDHERLFSGEIDTPPFSPARLWRFSPEIFRHKGFGRAKSPYPYVTPETGIRDYSAMSNVDRSTVQMILIVAESFLEEREKKGEFQHFTGAPSPLNDTLLSGTVRQEFRRIIGRDPTEAEGTRYLAFLRKNIEAGGNLDGLKTTLKAMFLSPEAIYRMEFGLGKIDEYGRRLLSPDELAYALAYALTDRGPDRTELIRDAHRKGKLKTPEDVARVVRKLLDEQLGAGRWSDRKLPRILRFFEEFFGFHRAGVVFKDRGRRHHEAIPQWNTEMLIHDARLLIEHVLKQDKDVFAELLTTPRFFIAHPGDNEYAREFYEARVAEVTAPDYVDAQVAKKKEQLKEQLKKGELDQEELEKRLDRQRAEAEKKVIQFEQALARGRNPHPNFPFSNRSRGIADLIYIVPYNLPANSRIEEQRWKWPIEQPLEMLRDQRAGLLTHPAWLAAWSLNEDNDPIHRGIWVRERLLAGVLTDVSTLR